MLEIANLGIIGKSKVISTSKIKKIIAIKKKCKENGKRDLDFGSNPHSKGLLFSRSIHIFFEHKFKINNRKIEIKIIILAREIKIFIIYLAIICLINYIVIFIFFW